MENSEIDWNSSSSHILINTHCSKEERQEFETLLLAATHFPGHIWLATSGSTSMKWVGLSKKAIMASALSVNNFLKSTKNDRWIQALPRFHVGGLGIEARCFLAGSKLFNFRKDSLDKWQPQRFHDYVLEKKGTLTALVPAQLHDLLKLNLPPPPSLRAIIVGGGILSPVLYKQAIQLGWPIFASYGMTECSSQIATGGDHPNTLEILPHVQVRIEEGLICVKSEALLTTYAYKKCQEWHFIDPKKEGWYRTADRGELSGELLSILGRSDQVVKIGGESVDIEKLEGLLQEIRGDLLLKGEMVLVDIDDDRLGKFIAMVAAGAEGDAIESIKNQFNSRVMPYERIRKVCVVNEIPKSPLMKVLKNKLRDFAIF